MKARIAGDTASFEVATAAAFAHKSKNSLWLLSKARDTAEVGAKAVEQHVSASLSTKDRIGVPRFTRWEQSRRQTIGVAAHSATLFHSICLCLSVGVFYVFYVFHVF